MQISAKNVNTPSVFPIDCEVYYSIRTLIDANEYPQVHDFYEMTESNLGMEICFLSVPVISTPKYRPGTLYILIWPFRLIR